MFSELRFRVLCQRYRHEIFRYALALVGNRADAEEITQETLIRLWHNIQKVRFANARAWVYRTTRNLCLDHFRRRSSGGAPVFVSDEVLSDHADEEAPDPRRIADTEFVRERVTAALFQMPEKLRSVLVLYEVNGLRYREIAEALEMPINSVKVYLLRARAKLKELLTHREPWITNYVD